MKKMDHMTDEIKAADAFNAWFTTYVEYENTIRNGAVKLRNVRMDISQATTPREALKFANVFVVYFENNDVDGKVRNIYHLTALESTSTTRNLFGLYVDNFGCDVAGLAKLMMVYKEVMILGGHQILTYYYLKGSISRAVSYYDEFITQLYEIRSAYEKYSWNCYSGFSADSQHEVDKIVNSGRDESDLDIAKGVFNRLASLYPFYAWAVVSSSGERFPEDNDKKYCNPKSDWCRWYRSALKNEGDQYFQFEGIAGAGPRRVLVLWQDPSDKLTCTHKDKADTVVFYMRGTGFSGTDFGGSASKNFLTKRRCNDEYFFGNPPPTSNTELHKRAKREVAPFDWVAAGEERSWESCDSAKSCHGHGTCRNVLFTRKVLCFCDARYDGEHCEVYEDALNEENILKLSQIESIFGQIVGIPDIIDVYFALQDVEKTINAEFQALQDIEKVINDGFEAVFRVTEFLEALTKYSETMNRAQYVASLYNTWRQGNINDRRFAKAMSDFIEKSDTLPYIILQLKNALTAGGALDIKGQDVFNTYKKAYVATFKNACTPAYNSHVKNMMIQLAGLDLLMANALFQYVLISKRYADINAGVELIEFVEENLEASKYRLQQYDKYWRETSCGDSSTIATTNIQCFSKHSYSGLAVSVTCKSGYKSSASEMICTGDHDQDVGLHWDPVVSCDKILYQNSSMRLESYYSRGWWLDCALGICELTQYGNGGREDWYGRSFCLHGQDAQVLTQHAIGISYSNHHRCDLTRWIGLYNGETHISSVAQCPINHPDFLSQLNCPFDTMQIYKRNISANQELVYGDTVFIRFDYKNLWMSIPQRDHTPRFVVGSDCPGDIGEHIHGSCDQELWIIHEAL